MSVSSSSSDFRRSHARIAIVGNAPEVADHAAEIDAADIVVRFNNTHGLGGVTGSRTTYLFLVNHGGQMREWLETPGFTERRAVRDAEQIFFPIHPMTANLYDPPLTQTERMQGEAEDWTMEASRVLGATGPGGAGKQITLLPATFFREACEGIGTRVTSGMRPPSTGYLATRYFAETMGPQDGEGGCRIDCYGFGFDGWEAHAWDAEREWFEGAARRGDLVLHRLGGVAGSTDAAMARRAA